MGERLLRKRREEGWSIRRAARRIGVDPGTWRDWEAGTTILYRKHRTEVAKLLSLEQQGLLDQTQVCWNGKDRRRER